MKPLAAAVLLEFACYWMVGALVWAPLSPGQAIEAVTVPLLLAGAAGAVMWSWAEPRAKRGG